LHRCVTFHDTLYAVYGVTVPEEEDVAGADVGDEGTVSRPGAWGTPPE
jgi:hypothetical protein